MFDGPANTKRVDKVSTSVHSLERLVVIRRALPSASNSPASIHPLPSISKSSNTALSTSVRRLVGSGVVVVVGEPLLALSANLCLRESGVSAVYLSHEEREGDRADILHDDADGGL